ncbi:ABC transporter permease [Ghiorsea bivora]|uniref:ABC transporter permease n=1 Tax=Ghiorsea bivora TaxID=1485545 RepID=UPI00057138CB|nr:ABC transporter permease [Ghiorsea bivora]
MYSRKVVVYRPRFKENFIQGMLAEIGDLWRSRYVGVNLFRVKLSERYQGSVLGVLWSVITPVVMMVIMAIIFPLIMKMRVENYVVYLFSGLVVFRLLSSTISMGSNAVVGYKALISKVALPSMLYPTVIVAVEFANFLLVMVALHFVALAFSFEINTHLLYLFVSIVITLFFCIGLASLLSLFVVYYRDIKQILEMAVQGLFYLTPIVYPIMMVPEKYHVFMEFNVMFQFVRLFHQAIYSSSPPVWGYMVAPLGLAIVVFLLGLAMHRRLGRQLVFRL